MFQVTCISILDLVFDEHNSSPRIFHGKNVLPTERPYQVRLLAAEICGGSLIATNWVLTAAHCLMEDESCENEALGRAIIIQAGIVDRDTVSEHPKEMQESTIKPAELNTNVFSPSFYDWIEECKSSQMKGYGRKIFSILQNMDSTV